MFALQPPNPNMPTPSGGCYNVDFDMISHGQSESKDFFHTLEGLGSNNNNKEAVNYSQQANAQQMTPGISFPGRESSPPNSFPAGLFPPPNLQQQHASQYSFNSQVLSPNSEHNLTSPPNYLPTLMTQGRDGAQPYGYFPPSPMKPHAIKLEEGGANTPYLAFLNRHRKAPTKVPDEQKSDSYWKRRTKNNLSAKKSRDKKRIEEKRLMQEFCLLSEELYKDLLAYYTLQKAKDLIGGPEVRRRRSAELSYTEEILQFYYYEGLLYGLKEANKNRGLPLRALIPWKQCFEDLNMWTDRRFISYVNSEQLSSSSDSVSTAYFPANTGL